MEILTARRSSGVESSAGTHPQESSVFMSPSVLD
jgi:hypothetical protein